MPLPTKAKKYLSTIERIQDEASWLLSHAESLADYGRKEEAAIELARAARCEEEVACFLEAAGEERKAALHRISAASCHQQLGEYPQAVTLLRAALSVTLPEDSRRSVEQQLNYCLTQAKKGKKRTQSLVAERK